ncbi:MAG: hypothetical protein N3B68_02910 [Anaerolineae bacterium]|nr:hypothetical protein [Anaerolineae bacterium]
MVDLWSVAVNALWVLGLALILTALSWANWVAVRERIPFRRVLDQPGVRRTLDGGLVLFCAGLTAAGRTRWEQALGSILTVGVLALSLWEERRSCRKKQDVRSRQSAGPGKQTGNTSVERRGGEE